VNPPNGLRQFAMNQTLFRLTSTVFAVLLCVQCVWILLAELSSPGADRLPTDAASAAAVAKQRSAAAWAAWIGGIRGDLWAKAAFTHADELWDRHEAATGPSEPLAALSDVRRALDLAPVNASAWLFLADLSSRFPAAGVDAIKALKMSYYTGPSEQELIPFRLRLAAQSEFVEDVELRDFISRDVRLLLARHQNAAVAAAYNSASASGKPFLEQTIRQTDPSALPLLRQALPD
jgi:hypothetical protein